MYFNIKNCKVMRISKKAQPVETDLCMNESPLDVVSEFKDMGLIWSSTVTYLGISMSTVLFPKLTRCWA